MGFVAAKCPACAKDIEIPAEEREFFCPYCGSKFLRDAAYAFATMPSLTTDDADLSDFVIVGTTLVAYRGDKPHVVIPSHVTVISPEAFKGNKYLSSVTIPDSVTSIESNCFSGCTSLTQVNISNRIVSIGDCTFRNCKSLTAIDLPRSLEQLGSQAFDGCSSLVSVLVPSGCTYHMYPGGGPFVNCDAKVTKY